MVEFFQPLRARSRLLSKAAVSPYINLNQSASAQDEELRDGRRSLMRIRRAYMKDRAPILNAHIPTSSQEFSGSGDDGATNGNSSFCQRRPCFC